MFSQFIGKSGPDALYCPLCIEEVRLIYIKLTKEYKCPNCGSVMDDRTRFTRRKTKLIAPNAPENQTLKLSQVSASEYMSSTSLNMIKSNKYSSPREAWDAD